MRFRILGPLEVWDGRCWAGVAAAKQRVLLAVLLLKANQMVPADWLIEQLWAEQPPAGAANQLQVYVSRLRRLLNDRPGLVLVTQSPGYRLVVGAGELDLQRFEELVASGRRALQDGELERAAGALGEALGLWRGLPLADVPSGPLVDDEAARLKERRLLVEEDRADVELRLGRHGPLVGELQALLAQQPLRERLWAQLLLALYRSGRQANALMAYQQLCHGLAEELGIAPSPPLQRLHRQMLAADPALEAPPHQPPDLGAIALPMVAPRQLPPDVVAFTGRKQELAQIGEILAASHPGAVAMCAINGTGGIGKSALAIHAAHQLASRFPDGQLYVNLQGTTPGLGPLAPMEALGQLLRTLGLAPAAIPDGVQEASALLRSLLSDRRMLLVLDNADDTAQVCWLLPASPTCAVLITSRRVLATLDGACHLHLDVLTEQEALALLGTLAGQQRIAAEPEAARRITALCGYLPLAIRVVGAKLTAKRHWPLATMVDRLADEHRRLDELAIGDLEVRASVALSYRTAGVEERQAFRMLGLITAPSFATWTLAALLDSTMPAADQMLERLFDAQLLEIEGRDAAGQMRHRFHDLIRVFARECLWQEEPDAVRREALLRHHHATLLLAEEADAYLRPGEPRLAAQRGGAWLGSDPDVIEMVRSDPQRWFEAERSGLLAVVEQAHDAGLWTIATRMACALAGFFEIRSYWDDWRHSSRLACHAGQQAGDPYDLAVVQHNLGHLHRQRGDFPAATESFQHALDRFSALDRRGGVAATLHGFAQVNLDQGNLHQASANFEQCLLIFRELGDRLGEGVTLRRLGFVRREQGDFAAAAAFFDQALVIFGQLGDQRGQAYTRHSIGVLHREQGRLHQAIACFDQALPAFSRLSDRRGEATTLHGLGDAYRDCGRDGAAMASFERCLVIFRELGDPLWEAAVLHSMGELHREQGRLDEAIACFNQALPLVRAHGDRRGEASILHSLAGVHSHRGHDQHATALFQQSLELFHELGFGHWEARGL